MGDAENALPPSKKRAAGKELSRDNPGLDDEEDSSELESGTFKKASDEVLATRRIVKVRRNQATSTSSSNPFAGIRLVPSSEHSVTAPPAKTEPTETVIPAATEPTETVTSAATGPVESSQDKVSVDANNEASKEAEKGTKEDSKQSERTTDELAAAAARCEPEKGEDKSSKQSVSKNETASENAADEKNTDDKENGAGGDETTKSEVHNGKTAGAEKPENEEEKETNRENSDPSQLSSFGQLSSTQNAFTGLAGTGFSTSTFSFGSISKDGSTLNSSSGSFFGQVNNGNSSLFSAPGTSIASKSEGTSFPSMQEVVVETGEENEKVVFSADSVLFEFLDGSWKERGKGELKVNVSTTAMERARLVMRARGNYRLILNASLYPDMKLTNMEKKGITFACINSDGKGALSTFAAKFKDASIVEEFRTAVAAHKGNTTAVLKTPENSPKATDV